MRASKYTDTMNIRITTKVSFVSFVFSLLQNVYVVLVVSRMMPSHDGIGLHCLLCILHINVPGSISVWLSFMTTLLVSPWVLKTRHGNWLSCWMSMGGNNVFLWSTHLSQTVTPENQMNAQNSPGIISRFGDIRWERRHGSNDKMHVDYCNATACV